VGSGRPYFPDEQRFHLKDVFMSVLMDDTAHIRDSTAFAPGLTTYRFRQNSTALQLTGPSLGQLRLTIAADTTDSVVLDHVAIGIWDGNSGCNCTATPVEVTFSGGHGCTVPGGATLASDWISFAIDPASQSLVVILDVSASNPDTHYPVRDLTNASLTMWKSGAASYNSATDPSGATGDSIWYGVSKIETQAGAGAPKRAHIAAPVLPYFYV
jgi:hypothetical protein